MRSKGNKARYAGDPLSRAMAFLRPKAFDMMQSSLQRLNLPKLAPAA
jgi:hypothetical protein